MNSFHLQGEQNYIFFESLEFFFKIFSKNYHLIQIIPNNRLN